ncbi:hypothetical protein ABEH63_20060 [Pseudomonas syringae]|uniref:hypothetical protein n=1 Tax=Pseudomonas syringae TaxID=317 RepID=UPI003209D167
MKSYQVEYLAVIEAKEDFCSTVESFNSLLQAYGSIKPVNNKINYMGSVFDYSVRRGLVGEEQQVYYHLNFVCAKKESLSDFRKFLKLVRTILQKVSVKTPEVLWDDLSGELCAKAYPVMYDLENLMRKLITKFMVISIGVSWVNSAVPKEVSDSVKIAKGGAQSYLYDTDFIQLSNFLFKKYSTANSDKLLLKLSKADSVQDLDFSELKEMIPRSNWERFFLGIVDCNSDYLDARWKKLYELRCIVAHNNFLSIEQYDEVIKLSAEINEKLSKAVDNLDKVHVSEAQKEEVFESVTGSKSEDYASFMNSWYLLATSVSNLCEKMEIMVPNSELGPRHNITTYVRVLKDLDVIGSGVYNSFLVVSNFRNAASHAHGRLDATNVEMMTQIVENLRGHIDIILSEL